MSECNCKPFCETHGRDHVVQDAYDFGGEGCSECAADGFSGELCWPDANACHVNNVKANRWERQFMCWRHRLQHVWFCGLADLFRGMKP